MDENTIFFDQCKLSKQTSYWSKTGFSFSVKNHNKFSSKNMVISSQNNVPKYHTKGHEQVSSKVSSRDFLEKFRPGRLIEHDA
jgi:hypothetical protein